MSDHDEANIASFCVQLGARSRIGGPHFYRCGGCCEVFTSTEQLDVTRTQCACGFGGTAKQWLEYLGQAAVDRLLKESERCPCDARCTNARGPNCDCQCGGVNHGSGLTVTVLRDCGPVPVVGVRDPEACKRRRAEARDAYHAAEARMTARFGRDLERFAKGIWMKPERWQEIRAAKEQLSKACSYKTHAKRLESLAAVCPDNQPEQ